MEKPYNSPIAIEVTKVDAPSRVIKGWTWRSESMLSMKVMPYTFEDAYYHEMMCDPNAKEEKC